MRVGRVAAPALGALAFLNVVTGAVAFTWAPLGTVVSVAGVLAPLLALGVAAARAPWRWARWLAGGLAAAAFVLGLLALPFVLMAIGGDERLATQPAGAARLVLTRTNCGATCDFGIRLERERVLLPGVVRRRQVGYWYHADTAVLTPYGADSVRVLVGWRSDTSGRRSEVVRLGP